MYYFTLSWPQRLGRWNLCQMTLCWSLTWLLSGTRMNFPLSLKRGTQTITTAWNDTEAAWSQELGHFIWMSVRVVLPLVGVETQKAEEHSYLLEHILGQMASPFPPNSSILSPNGKTVSVTPQKIISSPPRPAPFSLTFCLILFSMQGITLPEIPEMSNNKSKNWRNEKHGFPSAPQIMRRLGCLAPRRPKHLENWLLACYPDVWTLWEIVVLSFGAQHKTKDIQNKQNTQITSSTSFVRNVLELGFLFWVCGYGIIPSFSLLYEVQIGHKTW